MPDIIIDLDVDMHSSLPCALEALYMPRVKSLSGLTIHFPVIIAFDFLKLIWTIIQKCLLVELKCYRILMMAVVEKGVNMGKITAQMYDILALCILLHS